MGFPKQVFCETCRGTGKVPKTGFARLWGGTETCKQCDGILRPTGYTEVKTALPPIRFDRGITYEFKLETTPTCKYLTILHNGKRYSFLGKVFSSKERNGRFVELKFRMVGAGGIDLSAPTETITLDFESNPSPELKKYLLKKY